MTIRAIAMQNGAFLPSFPLAPGAQAHYLPLMVFSRKNSIWKDVSPKGAVSDFVAVFRDAGPRRWRIALAAAACTGITFSMLTREEHRIPQRLPTITYINSWQEGRSDKEIIAGNIANQKLKEREAAEAARDAQETRDLYKALGRASGMDVDAIERQAKADEAAEAAAKKAGGGPVAPTAK